MQIYGIKDVDTLDSIATIASCINLYWNDPWLAWDPKEFGNVTETRVFTDPENNFAYIWVPDIQIFENFNT